MSFRRPEGLSGEVVSAVLGSLVGNFAVVSFTFLAILGFAGGAVPVLGWVLPGGLLPGLGWLMLLGSAGLVVLWFVPLLAVMAVCSAFGRLRPATAEVVARRPRPLKQAA